MDAAMTICMREAGHDDAARYRLAREIGLGISTVLADDHGIHLVNREDWLRLVALDEALARVASR